MYKHNSNKIIDSYLKKNNNHSNIKKLMTNGPHIIYAGFASYSETIMIDLYKNVLELYFSQLFHAVNIVIDTGLHSSVVDYKFTIDNAKMFMKKLTILNDDAIHANVLKCLASPGQICAYDFGYANLKVLEQKMIEKGYSIKEYYSLIYKLPLPLKILHKYINEMPNK